MILHGWADFSNYSVAKMSWHAALPCDTKMISYRQAELWRWSHCVCTNDMNEWMILWYRTNDVNDMVVSARTISTTKWCWVFGRYELMDDMINLCERNQWNKRYHDYHANEVFELRNDIIMACALIGSLCLFFLVCAGGIPNGSAGSPLHLVSARSRLRHTQNGMLLMFFDSSCVYSLSATLREGLRKVVYRHTQQAGLNRHRTKQSLCSSARLSFDWFFL